MSISLSSESSQSDQTMQKSAALVQFMEGDARDCMRSCMNQMERTHLTWDGSRFKGVLLEEISIS